MEADKLFSGVLMEAHNSESRATINSFQRSEKIQ